MRNEEHIAIQRPKPVESSSPARLFHQGLLWCRGLAAEAAANIGTLWRSATTYDAAFLATVGRRYDRQASDTCNSQMHVPLFHHLTLEDLLRHLPHGCQLIGVELTGDAVPLGRFVHPLRALYLLGAEDHGLPPEVLLRCHQVVRIPSPVDHSLNVAAAGSIVIADRYISGLAARRSGLDATPGPSVRIIGA